MEREEKLIYYNNLYDIYGALLNEREKEIFLLFYEEDLSLGEIAAERGVSKSAIGNAIKTINQKLDDYEDKLHFFEKIKLLNSLDIKNEKLREEIKNITLK